MELGKEGVSVNARLAREAAMVRDDFLLLLLLLLLLIVFM